MLAVNGRAKEELNRILAVRTDSPQKIVRLSASPPNRFRLAMDSEKPDDRVIEHEGAKILVVDNQVASNLGDYTLAFENKNFIMAKGPLSGFNKSVVMLSE
jgi:Fe-S cluster assembly iron-binding protein IscA